MNNTRIISIIIAYSITMTIFYIKELLEGVERKKRIMDLEGETVDLLMARAFEEKSHKRTIELLNKERVRNKSLEKKGLKHNEENV